MRVHEAHTMNRRVVIGVRAAYPGAGRKATRAAQRSLTTAGSSGRPGESGEPVHRDRLESREDRRLRPSRFVRGEISSTSSRPSRASIPIRSHSSATASCLRTESASSISTLRERFAAIYPPSEFVAEGGLMSYGPDDVVMFQRTAVYVDRILRAHEVRADHQH